MGMCVGDGHMGCANLLEGWRGRALGKEGRILRRRGAGLRNGHTAEGSREAHPVFVQGAPSEAIRDGVTGRQVEARDAGAPATAAVEPLEDPRLATRWGAAGRSLTKNEFGAERMARETAAIYEELLHEPAAAPHG